MRLTSNDLKAIPAHVRRLNPDLFGVVGLPAANAQPDQRAPQADSGGEARRERGVGKGSHRPARPKPAVSVSIIAFANRYRDDDNIGTSYKTLRDAIADSLLPGLAAGQADAWFRWEYGFVRTGGEEGTMVVIRKT